MTVATKSNPYQRSLELAEDGDYPEALARAQEHLRTEPEDVQALNDAGAILYCLGRPDEAIDHFVKARSLQNGSAEILRNLVEAYLAVGRANEVIQLFDDMEQMGILKTDMLNRIANLLLDQDNKGGAIEILQKSLQIAPEQKILEPMIEVIRSKMPKVAFFCGGDREALNEITEFIKRRFEVRLCEAREEKELYESMKSSDICWFEQCANLAVTASKLPKVCKIIYRLQHHEAYKQWPKEVNWANIDVLVTVGNSFFRDALTQTVPEIDESTSIVTVPNGVNLEKFEFKNRRRGKNIAFLGNLRMVTNPAFVLQCMQKLHYIDPEYRLFFGGQFEDAALEQYLRYIVDALGLRDVVFFDGGAEDVSPVRSPGASSGTGAERFTSNGVSCWLEDKHYIVSTGIIEGDGMGLLEGMACGLKPVIHNFPGAQRAFPQRFLFNISEEFCEQILSDNYEPQWYRRFVEENYPLENQLININDIFTKLETESVTGDSWSASQSQARHLSVDAEHRIPVMSVQS